MSFLSLSPDASLLLFALVAVLGLVALVAWLRINAFVALLLASLFVGLTSGRSLPEVVKAFQEGLGATLGNVAAVIGLGAMIGGLLGHSGGADVVAKKMVAWFGPGLLPWALLAAAILVGIPTWFVVGLVLLLPILRQLGAQSNLPFLRLGLPVVAALSVMHSLVPPHPGAMRAVDALGADTGQAILWTLALGVPSAILAGPIYARWIAPRLSVPVPGGVAPASAVASPPGFWLTILAILLPVALMLAASGAEVVLPKDHGARPVIAFLGSALVSMLLAFLFAFWALGLRRGLRRADVGKIVEESLVPVGAILLVVGGGGGFSKVMDLAGTDEALARAARGWALPPPALGGILAAALRVAVGSSTVAITTAAGLIAPMVAATPGANPALLVAVLGAGSLFCSHLNDGGFWFVKESFQMTAAQTAKTWSVATIIASVTALILGLAVDALWR